jgi:hypothetical protein
MAAVTGVARSHQRIPALPAGRRAVDFQGVQVRVPSDWPTFTDQGQLVDCEVIRHDRCGRRVLVVGRADPCWCCQVR